MKKILLWFVFLSNTFLFAGKYVNAFLELGVSARSLAMGNSTGAVDTTGAAFILNPAGVAYIENWELNFMYTTNFGMASTNYCGVVKGFGEKMGFGVGWIRFCVEDIPIRPDIFRFVSGERERRDTVRAISRLALATFSDTEDAIFISLGKKIVRYVDFGWKYTRMRLEIPVGVNVKLVRKRLYFLVGNGIGMDFGFRVKLRGVDLFDIKGIGDFIFGVTYRDVGGCTIYWSSKKQDCEEPDRLLSFGFVQPVDVFDSVFIMSLQKSKVYGEVSGGVEIGIRKAIFLRMGYNYAGVLLGGGITFNKFGILVSVDYALCMHRELAAGHRVSGGVKF